jgi:predicted permease
VATLKHLSSSIGGSNPETLLAVQLDARGTPHSDTALQAATPELARRFRALPGVSSVAESYVVPLIYGGLPSGYLDLPGLESSPESDVEVAVIDVGPGYFRTLGIQLIAGRDFDSTDARGSARVAVISENLALHFFNQRSPIGQHFRYRGGSETMQVVGVVADAKQVDLRAPAPWTVYEAREQKPGAWGDRAVFAIRTTVPPAQLVPAARAVILEALPGIRVRHLHPMADLLSITVGKERALAMLSVAFGLLAVVLASVGLYGVMAFQVSARTREIGVRMALGASRAQVIRMVVGQGFTLVILGVAIGVPLAIAGARSLRALLYGVTPFDPVTLATASVVLVAVGIVASLLPSRNAARVDPLIAIRSE